MKKRIILLATVLSILITLFPAPVAYAASEEAVSAAETLHELGLFNGTGTDANGNPIYDLDRAPTRYEAVTMLVRLLGKGEEAQNGTWNTPFVDVVNWAKPYVGYAYANGLTSGTSATTFGGDSNVSATQYCTFVLRALGYDSSKDFKWNEAVNRMKRILTALLLFCISVSLAAPAYALEYKIGGASGAEYGKATSIDVVLTPDGGAAKNEDMSKNAALIPPTFGSASADTLYTGEYLTPNLVPGMQPGAGSTVNGSGGTQYPPSVSGGSAVNGTGSGVQSVPPAGTQTPSAGTSTGYTAVTDDLYYSNGSLGTLTIPAIGVNTKIYEGTGDASLAKGAGHFPESSIWAGNVCLAGHNRGTNEIFGKIHTLSEGDTVTLTTKLGTRTYRVVSVSKISETDWSGVAYSSTNMISLYTCVMNEREYRWCVQAVAA